MDKFWKLRKLILRSNGNAMTTSLMVTGASAAISAFLFSQSLSTDQAAKIPRIKSAMNQVEISLRAMILQPGTFTCAQAGASTNANCSINLASLSAFERELPGADSGAGARCKIAIQDAGIGVAGNTTVNGSPFVATLKYLCASDSSASKIAPQRISVDIPGEVTTVSADTFTCADIDINKPILVGFNSSSGAGTGGIKCAALKNATCPANYFVSGVDYQTMKVTCSQISSTAVAAASTEMLGGLTWTGDTFTQTSLTRKNPSAYPPVGPMFTMSSSKNAALVGKPADVPSGGSCVCDVPKTTCWNGDQVCSPAGESCPPAPVSPAPSVAASVAPSTAPSVAASIPATVSCPDQAVDWIAPGICQGKACTCYASVTSTTSPNTQTVQANAPAGYSGTAQFQCLATGMWSDALPGSTCADKPAVTCPLVAASSGAALNPNSTLDGVLVQGNKNGFPSGLKAKYGGFGPGKVGDKVSEDVNSGWCNSNIPASACAFQFVSLSHTCQADGTWTCNPSSSCASVDSAPALLCNNSDILSNNTGTSVEGDSFSILYDKNSSSGSAPYCVRKTCKSGKWVSDYAGQGFDTHTLCTTTTNCNSSGNSNLCAGTVYSALIAVVGMAPPGCYTGNGCVFETDARFKCSTAGTSVCASKAGSLVPGSFQLHTPPGGVYNFKCQCN